MRGRNLLVQNLKNVQVGKCRSQNSDHHCDCEHDFCSAKHLAEGCVVGWFFLGFGACAAILLHFVMQGL